MTPKKGATIWARQTIESDIFFWKPDKWFKIWFFLVNQANHADTKQFKRGECFITGEEIMRATRASIDQVKKCLAWLRKNGMIDTERSTRGMTIRINKYKEYQDFGKYSSTEPRTRAAPERHQRSTTINKNEKNVRMKEDIILQPQASAEPIKKIFEVFQMTVNPTINYGNTTQRKAAQALIDDLGSEEKALKLAQYACSIQGEAFAPTVTTPYQLREKAAQIRIHWQKENSKQQSKLETKGITL